MSNYYTNQEIREFKYLFGANFNPYEYGNERSDFSRLNTSLIAKGLANWIKRYHKLRNEPAEYEGFVDGLSGFSKDSKINFKIIRDLFEFESKRKELASELSKHGIKLTYRYKTITLKEV